MSEIDPPTTIDPDSSTGSPETSQTSQAIQLTPLAVFLLMVTIFILGLGTGFLIWARPLEARAVAAEQKLVEVQKTVVASQVDVNRYPVPIDDDPILGNKDAKITIIEFSDYECYYCRLWQQETYPKIKEKYGDQVRLVYRDFPLYGTHPNAESAAEAANCAGSQDKYQDFHDLLFNGGMELGAKTYETYAKQLNMDLVDFKKCMDEHRFLDEVKADYKYAGELGVRSTPTFFVNGLALIGAQPFEVFQQVIDLELSGQIPQ